MEEFKEEGKAVGLIFDISLRHDNQGKRIIDVVKKSLVEVIRKGFEDDVDSLYLYHPDLIDCLYNHGEQTSAIGNYESDGWRFNLENALKQSIYVVAGEDRDFRKYLLLITDRLTSKSAIDKVLFINMKDRIECKVVVVGIGDRYDRSLLENALHGVPEATFIHLSQPSQLFEALLKENIDGTRSDGNSSDTGWQEVCGQTSEFC